MVFMKEQSTFKSTDGIHDISYFLYIPEEVKAAVVIIHGMYEFKERYAHFAEFLAQNGMAVLCYDQLGHGASVNDPTEKGWFGESEGVKYLQGDVLKAVEAVREKFYGKKIVLFGHSMGSFVVRYFAVNNTDKIDSLIICGTNGGNSSIDLAIALSAWVSRVNGSKYVNTFIDKLTMGSNNKRFEKLGETSPNAWISRDKNIQNESEQNSFIFTCRGFCDMFKMLKYVSSSEWYARFPKKLPTFIISGEDDPIGDFGKGVINVYMKLRIKKVQDVELKLYPECRHEILNELNKEEVYSDIVNWIKNKNTNTEIR